MKRRITHQSARNKGKQTERYIAKQLSNMGLDAKRVPMSGALSWLKGDIVEFNSVYPHLHEAKNQEQLSLGSWWKQATEQCLNGEVPVLHFTSNYKPLYTMLDSKDFDEMLYAYESLHREMKLQLLDLPSRKNFWKFTEKMRTKHTIFTTPEERVIMLFDLYLMLRRADVKVRTQAALHQVEAVPNNL